MPKSTMQTINENSEQLQEDEEQPNHLLQKENTPSSAESSKSYRIKDLPIIEETDELETTCRTPEPSKIVLASSMSVNIKKSKKRSIKVQKIDVESLVKSSLKEWLTIESYIFLFGEEKVKEILDGEKLSAYFDKLNIVELKREQQIKYMEICKRLHLQDMADEKFDNSLLGSSKLKPVPDYQKLKAENKELSIKVRCFYSGVLHEKDDPNFPRKSHNSTDKENIEDEPPAVLPLVDIKSQTALRRKIFLASINKS